GSCAHKGSQCQPLNHASSPPTAVQFTGDWETGWVTANTSYKSFSRAMVNAEVGLHIGLAGVNVTLVGNPVNQINETINYNEHFDWTFGTNYDDTYKEGLAKGLPSPILYVAEKFTQNSPCGVYSQYRISSHYTSATMWVAFCAWLISNMLFSMPVLVYGGYMILVTGTFMIFSLLSFSTVRNSPLCTIQFGPASLQTVYGGSFWLTLATSRPPRLLCVKKNSQKTFSFILRMDPQLCWQPQVDVGGSGWNSDLNCSRLASGAVWGNRPAAQQKPQLLYTELLAENQHSWQWGGVGTGQADHIGTFNRLWILHASGKNSHSLYMFSPTSS
uniref:Dual oxidase maturation factor 1 n=1 Tax=Pelusios castaneus TaxID=367368 RepID=A0A8C8SR39_9SAUR